MKLAVLSDIHGNINAFEQILKKSEKEGISKFLFLGDFVGYYYWPEKVLEKLSKLDSICIQGNHERILNGLLEDKIKKEDIIEKYGSGHDLAIKKLSKKQIDFLVNLPESRFVGIDGCKFQLCHGSPTNPDQYIYPDTSLDIMNDFNVSGADFVLIGHSHYQFILKIKDSLLINVGSVGQSRSIGGLAQWAIINTNNRNVQLMSTPYETSDLIKSCIEIDPNLPYLREVLLRN
ncbi:metallophosphoesterase family protein [Aquirufa aurantiipilula]|uniref:Metallophosphoesterase family protein n=1 Tax=Aquirufa aurantiipilula TaxID=2696561 RepID=A0ABT6BK53_9BACT|nr:metallophosphoesterase family protein [Aquirufa aurantiipilula]MDF5690831.1 metallophosphoesterase family protein [Aquirufa aurantiipilula]